MTPGWVRANDNAVLGGDTIAFVRRFVFDLAIMGIAACDAQHGWMDYAEENPTCAGPWSRRAVIGVLIVDESKFGRRASVRTFDLQDDLIVVTNRRPPEPFAGIFAEAGVRVIFERIVDAPARRPRPFDRSIRQPSPARPRPAVGLPSAAKGAADGRQRWKPRAPVVPPARPGNGP